MSDNFTHLSKKWENLALYAKQAEEYVYTDPQSAALKLSCFCESLVGIIYKDLKLPSAFNSSLLDKLNSGLFIDVVGEEVCMKLHALRMKGNRALHCDTVTIKDALWLLKEAYLLGHWLSKTYNNGMAETYPEFVVPQKRTLVECGDQSNVDMTEQLKEIKREVSALRLSESEAINEMVRKNLDLHHDSINQFKINAKLSVESMNLELHATQENISVNDSFAEYKLNTCQTQLIAHLDKFLSNSDVRVFLLNGCGGTGKTFITKGLTEYLTAIGRRFELAAPTGKAAKVISLKTGCPASTIHKLIYAFRHFSNNGDEVEDYNIYGMIAANEHANDAVFIIDEASMISDHPVGNSKSVNCGTNRILSDLMTFLNFCGDGALMKVIFIGDNAQLPPVGMDNSPALSLEYLSGQFGLNAEHYELTQIVRQKSESGVIKLATELRKALDTGNFNWPKGNAYEPEVIGVSGEDFMTKYLESCGGRSSKESIVITYTNSDAQEYNRRIRAHLFPNKPRLVAGDRVIAVANNIKYGLFISNGESGLVCSRPSLSEIRKVAIKIDGEYSDVELRFCDVEIEFNDIDGRQRRVCVKIIENLLYSNASQLSSDEQQALFIDFCLRNRHLQSGSSKFWEALHHDPYFNALRIKFGYAITCHRAQGSEWENVFVKISSHSNFSLKTDLRWMYTAITRTSNHLFLIDVPWVSDDVTHEGDDRNRP